MTVRVWLSGEGPNELGGWCMAAPYTRPAERGALVAMAEKRVGELEIVGATVWKDLRRYRAGRSDEDNVRKLALIAEEAGCDAVLFLRDTDGDDEVSAAVTRGVLLARGDVERELHVVGAAMHPCLEGWVLAWMGSRQTHKMGKNKAQRMLEEQGVTLKNTAAYVAIIDAADAPAEDVEALRRWLEEVAALKA